MQYAFDMKGLSFTGCGLCGNPMPECSCIRKGHEEKPKVKLIDHISKGLSCRLSFDALSFSVPAMSGPAAVASGLSMGNGFWGNGLVASGPSGGSAGGP